MKVLMAYPHNCDGSAYHRLHVPSLYLKKYGVDVTRIDDIFSITEPELAAYDILVVNRMVTRNTIDKKNGNPLVYTTEAIRRIKASGIRLVVDLDDTWNVPPSHPYAQFYADTNHKEAVIASIKAAHEVWCSTGPLTYEVNKLDLRKPFFVVPNGISTLDTQWHGFDRAKDPELRMGVVCNQPHLRDVAKLRDALHALRKQKGWRLMVIGVPVANQQEVRTALKCKYITFLPWLSVYDYAKHYAQMDVLLCPLEHTDFNLFRSDIKLAECAFTGTPALCENFGPYANTRYAVNNWRDALVHAVKEPQSLLQNIPTQIDHTTHLPADQLRLQRLKALVRNEGDVVLTKT